jgi:heme/copper-type cytochrome/quinol oxidase subunit 1
MTALPSFVFAHHVIPREPGSKDNLGPFVNVVTWILLITSGLAVLTRLITKRALRRRIDVDDAFVIAALVSHTYCSINHLFHGTDV